MAEITVTQDISSVWIKAVKDGKIVNDFEAPNGEKIQFGLTFKDGDLKYYARNTKIGCEIPAQIKERTIDESNFVIQYNGYRALKPGGRILNIGKQQDISAAATDCRFYCQNPKHNLSILRRDPLVQVALPNWRWNAYYNATPFEKEGHFLWLPVFVDGITTIIPHIPQELSHDFFEDALALFRNSNNLVIFFNSLHAGASVNHIHLQAVFHNRTLSIENASTVKQNGLNVLVDYPAHGIVFYRDTKSDEIWYHLDVLQNKKKVPFNLIFVGERIYLIPRNPDREVVEEFPKGVIASMELAGKIITVDENEYEEINYAKIWKAFQKTTTSIKEIYAH